jgi:MoaA/NifB/PqqE/SkfB family radical SAM enzyme
MMHPEMVRMIEYAKEQGGRVWLNTNGSRFGPSPKQRDNLRRLIDAKIDIIEFSMDAGDAETYAKVRPPLGAAPRNHTKRWMDQVCNVRAALEFRQASHSTSRIVVSMIRQEALAPTLEQAQSFWKNEIGVDEVITRKFLSWDDNTSISLDRALDNDLYQVQSLKSRRDPCVWPFERLNVDTLGRVALCGQDISFRTARLFANVHDVSIQEIWRGKVFNEYRRLHMNGEGGTVFPCKGCSAWQAGVRDWNFGWIQVLQKSGETVRAIMLEDLGYEVEVFTPEP